MRNLYLILAFLLLSRLFPFTDVKAQSLPHPALVGYWENWSSLQLDDIDDRYNVIQIAFPIYKSETDYHYSHLDLGPYGSNKEAFIKAVSHLQQAGKKVLLSIGGANHPVYLDDDHEMETFSASITEMLLEYGLDGIDIDLESSSVQNFSGITMEGSKDGGLQRLVHGIRLILKKYKAETGQRCLLTMAPETMYVQGGYKESWTWAGGYLPVIEALREDLDLLFVQYYNVYQGIHALDGQMYYEGTADFIVAMTEMLLQGFYSDKLQANFGSLPEEKVAIGLLACKNEYDSGFTASGDREKALNYLLGQEPKAGNYSLLKKGGYPNLGGLMTWSVNGDKNCRPAWGIAENFSSLWGQISSENSERMTGSQIFPNPSRGILRIKTNESTDVEILNIMGERVFHQKTQPGLTLLDVSFLSSGMYFLRYGNKVERWVLQ